MFGQNIDGFYMDESLAKGIAFQQSGQYAEAVKYFNIYLRDHRSKLSGKALTVVLGLLAVSYNLSGSYDESIRTYKELLPLLKDFRDDSRYALSLSNMGNVYAKKMHYTPASNCISQAIEIARKSGAGPQQLSISFQQLSSVLNKTGKLRQALKASLISLKYASTLSHNGQFLVAATEMAEVLRNLNMFDIGMQLIDHCLHIAEIDGNQMIRTMLLIEKAKFYHESGQTKLSEDFFQYIYDEKKNRNDLAGLADILYAWGMIYQNTGNFPFAVIKLGECEEICKKIGDKAREEHCKALLSDLIIKPVLDKEFKKNIGKSKQEINDLSSKITGKEGVMRLETRIDEITTFVDKILTMDISGDGSILIFGPMNKAFKVWDLPNKVQILSHKPDVNLNDLQVTFYPNSMNFVIAADITNTVNIHDSSLFIIIQKFYMGKTVDNQHKIVNFTFQRLETPDQDAYLIGLSSDGKIVYMMSEKFKGKPEDDYTDRMKKELKEPMRELADKALESIGIKMPEGPRSGDSFGDVIDTMFSTQKSLKPESRIKSIHAWETETGEFLYSCNFPELDISKKFLTFNFDNETLFFLNPDDKLEIRNFRYNKVLKEIDPHCWPCSYLTISKDFKVIAYENAEGDFEIYDVETGNLIDKIELRGERVREVDTNLDEKYGKSLADPFGSMVCKLSDDGNLLAFDGADGQFCIYNIPEKRIVKQFPSDFSNAVVFMGFYRENSIFLLATYKYESYLVKLK